MPLTWTPEDDDLLLALVADGKLKSEIAEQLGRCDTAINSRLKRLQGNPRPMRIARTNRRCLCCHREFGSVGPHHRLCSACRTRNVSPYAP